MRLCLTFLFSVLSIFASAQKDTSFLLTPERLTANDIAKRLQDDNNAPFFSANRTLENQLDLPYMTWVITGEEILRRGFVTLTDVLKAAPGIRVSQPGNAIEGETFLMRGLAGNQLVKILINDIPVKPSGALGMPIGAQLPIRQAERIEIMYGAAGGLMYGNEACAGVVNIILKETERPVFTQADLAIGTLGYNSLDLSFGGKLFQGKNVFRFNIYGSSTVRDRAYNTFDDSLLYMRNYLLMGFGDQLYKTNQNYRPRSPFDTIDISGRTPFSHESRMLGANFAWRGLKFSYLNMNRHDASALGMSPLAISYASQGDRLNEQMQMFSLSFQKKWKYVSFYTVGSLNRYKVENTSTFTHIFNRLNAGSFINVQAEPIPRDTLDALLEIYSRQNAGRRFGFSNWLDTYTESRLSVRFFKKLYLDIGQQSQGGGGSPLLTQFNAQLDNGGEPIGTGYLIPYYPPDLIFFNLLLFSQLEWRGPKFSITGGGQVNFNGVPSGRVAMHYKIDSAWTIYGNASTSYQLVMPYAATNTFQVYSFGNVTDAITVSDPDRLFNNDSYASIRSIEGGVRLKRSTPLHFFYLQADRLLRPALAPGNQTTGYSTVPGSQTTSWGFQSLWVRGGQPISIKKSEKKGTNIDFYTQTELFIQYARGKERIAYGLPVYNEVFNQPKWTTQVRFTLRANKIEATFSSNRQTSVLSKSVTYGAELQRQKFDTRYPTFRSWDMMWRIYLNRNFVLYANVLNLFNTDVYGLDATGTIDDLLRPVQTGRMVRFGVNYNMN